MALKPTDGVRPWGWPRSIAWALVFSLWAFGLIGVSIAAVSTWTTWRHVVHGYQRDAETIVYDETFPNMAPAPLRSAADAAEGVASANREFGADLATRGAIIAALLALAFAYRRAVPPEARPPRRVWILVVPLMVVFGAAVLFFLLIAVAGAIKG